MPRRDAFSSLRQTDPSPGTPPEPTQKADTKPSMATPAKQPLDLIPVAARRTKRNRDWDREHQAEKATYRGIPKRLQDAISELATSLNVPRDELVRAFLEYSLTELEANRLLVVAHPKAQRMTLFPTGETPNASQGKRHPSSTANWLEEAFPSSGRRRTPPGKKKQRKDQSQKDRWEVRATYRLPVILKEQVKAIADEHDVPIGELVLFFLDHGLGAYQTGELRLNPSLKATGKTLFLDD